MNKETQNLKLNFKSEGPNHWEIESETSEMTGATLDRKPSQAYSLSYAGVSLTLQAESLHDAKIESQKCLESLVKEELEPQNEVRMGM